MNLTKKRIAALITATLLLLSAAMLPGGTNINPFGSFKVNAADLPATDRIIYEFFDSVESVDVVVDSPYAIIVDQNNRVYTHRGADAPDFNGGGGSDGMMADILDDGVFEGTITLYVITSDDDLYSIDLAFSVDFADALESEGYDSNNPESIIGAFGAITTDPVGLPFTATAGNISIGGTFTYSAGFDFPYGLTLDEPTATNRYFISVSGGSASPTYAFEGETVTLTPVTPSGMVFEGWESDDVDVVSNRFTMPGSAVSVSAVFGEAEVPADPELTDPEPTYVSPSRGAGPSTSSVAPPPITLIPSGSGTGGASTPATGGTGASTPASNVVVTPEVNEDGTMSITIGNTEIDTASTSAAAAIAGGTASEVLTSGSAVAVVTKDNDVIAGANASGSMNSASTLKALNAAASDAVDGATITIETGTDVTAISASTLQKIAAAAEAAGVEAVISATAADETGAPLAIIDIPLTGALKNSIKTGISLTDESIDTAVAKLETQTGVKPLVSFATEQKTSFGTPVTFTFAAETLGLDAAAEGTPIYIAITRADGTIVQVEGIISGGKLTFTATSAGVYSISDKSFVK
jgi:hypothetical protein